VIQQSLEIEFKKLSWQVEWAPFTNSIKARNAVNDSPTPFDFAIVDLFIYEDEMEDGLEVLKDITDKSPGTYRLLVTSHSAKAPGFREDAKHYFNDAIDRVALGNASQWKFVQVAKKIIQNATAVGLLDIADTTYADDPRVMSLLNKIGRASAAPRFEQNSSANPSDERRDAGLRIIRNLALHCLEEISPANVTLCIDYAPTGKSGAQVCRIELLRNDIPRQAFILKLSFDRGMLQRESKANREAAMPLSPPDLIPLVGEVQSDSSGYHAIAARVASGTLTLRDWLDQPASERAAADVAKVLFGQILRPLFTSDGWKRVALEDWLTPSSWDIVRARATMSKYRAAIEDARAGGRRSARHLLRPLQDFLDSGRYPFPSDAHPPAQVRYVRAWGDLHAGNILVPTDQLPRPILIDASRYGHDHWASDAARLITDLFLRSRKPGVDGMVWDELDQALYFGHRLCPHNELRWGDTPTSVERFVSQCVEDLVSYTCAMSLEIMPDEWHWQWHAALAKEFLRQSSYDDLPPPRAVLSLLLAAAHMRISRLLIRKVGKQPSGQGGGEIT
jgi:hypothetical protein